jgi:hypothetical protein
VQVQVGGWAVPLYYCHRGIGGGGAIGGGRAKVVLYKSPPAPVFRCTAGTAVVGGSSGGGAGSGNFIVQDAVVTSAAKSRQRLGFSLPPPDEARVYKVIPIKFFSERARVAWCCALPQFEFALPLLFLLLCDTFC